MRVEMENNKLETLPIQEKKFQNIKDLKTGI